MILITNAVIYELAMMIKALYAFHANRTMDPMI